MSTVAALWRHPIKSHGREALTEVTLTEGQTMPWDRHWAVQHEASKFNADDPRWVMCRNFMIGVATPGLAGIWAELDEATATITLRHDALGSHTFVGEAAVRDRDERGVEVEHPEQCGGGCPRVKVRGHVFQHEQTEAIHRPQVGVEG